MSDEPRIAAFALAPVINGMVELGLDATALQRRAGFPDLEHCDADCRIPYRNAARLWDLIVSTTGDPAIGLRIAEKVNLEHYGLILYLARSNANLHDAMADVDRYGALLADGIRFRLRKDGPSPSIVVEFAGPQQPHPAGEDYAIGVLARAIRSDYSGLATEPLATTAEVRLTHPPPEDRRPYERFFRVPVRFSAQRDEVVLRGSAKLPAVTSPNSDPGLHDVLERVAAQSLRADASDEALERRLRDAVRSELPNGRPDASVLADRLDLGERSLRRRLAARGSSVSQIVDEVRLDLAMRYLGEARMSVADVARSLGFSEPSAFHRAFRRWTGKTPRGFVLEER